MKTLHEKATLHATNTWLDPSGDSREMVSLSEYTAFIAGYETLQHETRWRSVEEELPKDQGVVMVKTNTGSFATAYLHGKSSGFITYGTEAYLDFGIITHWKPIE